MKSKSKILFISHDSSLTGAPVLLLNLISLFQDRGLEINILLMRGGKLEEKFRKLGKTFVLKPYGYRKNANILKQFFEYIKFRKNKSNVLQQFSGCQLVFNNTVANGSILNFFKRKKIPILTYVHELESVIMQLNDRQEAALTFRYSDLFICPSNAVVKNLVKNHGIEDSKIRILPYYFPKQNIQKSDTGALLDRFEIPRGRFYVAGMGTATYRKGFDRFIKICKEVVKKDPEFYFVWIGGFVDKEMKSWYDKLVTGDLKNFFIITGEIPQDPANLQSWNIFLLSSREDPYPLVVIEAAQAGLPTIFFEGTGGIGDFIDNETGWPVSQDNIEGVVDLLISLKSKEGLVKTKGDSAKKKAAAVHENADMILKRCMSFFDEV